MFLEIHTGWAIETSSYLSQLYEVHQINIDMLSLLVVDLKITLFYDRGLKITLPVLRQWT